jgi:Domain of unknown function (DUF4157)
MRRLQLRRSLSTSAASQPSFLRRQCACGTHSTGGSCGKCDASAPPIVQDVLKSPGAQLDASTRVSAEQHFGQDLSHVRVHSGEKAAASASAVGALAYSVGPDLVFGEGQFSPSTKSGNKLLTHELTHAVQQPQRYSGGPLEIGDPASPAEREAEAASSDLDSHGIRVVSSNPAVRRQPNPAAKGTTPADFGISLVVVDHGAGDAHAAADARLQEIYGHLRPANLAQMKSDGITSLEMHIIPEDTKLTELPEFKQLKGKPTPDGTRLYDDIRGAGGVRTGSVVRFSVGEENLTGTHHHGLEIGLAIGGGAILGAAGAAIGVAAAMGKPDQGQSKREGIGGVVGGLLGAGLGAFLGYELGAQTKDKYGGYRQNFTAGHETSHTVEQFAFTPAQHAELQKLYDARKAANGPWLAPASYTSSNVQEYFAQCAAAYFREPYQDDYKDSYTPEWVEKNDPGMYALLKEVFTNPDGNAKQGALENQSKEKAAA